MKRFLSIALILVTLFCLASCSGNIFGKESSERDVVEIEGAAGAITLDEATIKELLSYSPPKALGLKKDIYDYTLVLSVEKFKEQNACRIEAFQEKAKEAEKVFLYADQKFYVYDTAKKKYLLLTIKGATEETTAKPKKKPTATTTQKTNQEIANDNNTELHKRFKKYDLSVLKLPKDIGEYNFYVTGAAAKVKDGKKTRKVYVVHIVEQDGTDTGYRLAIGDKGDYYFNAKKDTFVKLKAKTK